MRFSCTLRCGAAQLNSPQHIMKDPIIAVSSWALHQELGQPKFYGAGDDKIPIETHNNGDLTLLELPHELKERGIRTMELCHFHLPSRDKEYLEALREEMDISGITLHALLVDDGDLTSPETGPRDVEWIHDWLPVAARLGAQKARIIAGKTKGEKRLQTAALMLRLLSRYAEALKVHITTENWFSLLETPSCVKQLLADTEGRVGLNLDFGNWTGDDKYDRLAAIAPLASSCHAKADFSADGALDEDDFARCLNLPYPGDFRGPFTLVAGGWPGIEKSRDFILQHFEAKA
jgi:hypothetical protein